VQERLRGRCDAYFPPDHDNGVSTESGHVPISLLR
jgi:hypothetical protein